MCIRDRIRAVEFQSPCQGQNQTDFADLKKQAVQVYETCAKSLSSDMAQRLQTKVNDAIEGLKNYDAQIQDLQNQCDNTNFWEYLKCEARIQRQLMSIRSQARTNLIEPIYRELQKEV